MSNESDTQQLTCHRDSDLAIAACGQCSKPICEDHHRTVPYFGWEYHDSTFHDFTTGFGKLILLGVMLVAFLGLSFVVPENFFSDLSTELVGEELMIRPALTQSILLIFFTGSLTLWVQPSDQTFNFRILQRRTHNRKLCEECFSETVPEQALFRGLGLVSYGIVLFGLYQIIIQVSLLPLRIVVLGLLLNGLRTTILFIGGSLMGSE